MSEALDPMQPVDQMTRKQILRLLWSCWDDFKVGKITGKESDAFTRAANKRLGAIRRELRTADAEAARELIGC